MKLLLSLLLAGTWKGMPVLRRLWQTAVSPALLATAGASPTGWPVWITPAPRALTRQATTE